MIPVIQRAWQVTNEAAQALEVELSHPLSPLLEEAIIALEHKSFSERRENAAQHLDLKATI